MKKRPELAKIKTQAETEQEKDDQRLGNCMHPDEEIRILEQDGTNLYCDMNQEKNLKHPLFDDSGPALHCCKCGALICRDCYSGTPIPSPTSEEEYEGWGDNNNESSEKPGDSSTKPGDSSTKPGSSSGDAGSSSGNVGSSGNAGSSSGNAGDSSNASGSSTNQSNFYNENSNIQNPSFFDYVFVVISQLASILSELVPLFF